MVNKVRDSLILSKEKRTASKPIMVLYLLICEKTTKNNSWFTSHGNLVVNENLVNYSFKIRAALKILPFFCVVIGRNKTKHGFVASVFREKQRKNEQQVNHDWFYWLWFSILYVKYHGCITSYGFIVEW